MQYVAYYRVSTAKQGASGLGLEAQRAAVQSFLKCETCVLAEYVEVESGKQDNRQQLAAAIRAAKAAGARLVIAKLDRLSRNAAFIFELRNSGVDFVCADMPDANTLTIGIFATLAQHERELISQRTRSALAAKKAQGATLGKPENLTDTARAKGRAVLASRAALNENNQRAAAFATALHKAGNTLAAIASQLNTAGFKASRGGAFAPVQVQRLLGRD